MPRLVRGARERYVEAHLDNAIVGTEHRFAHRNEPRMRRDIHEPAHALGMDLDIETLRSAGQRATRYAARFLEQRLDVFAHPHGPGAIECALEADDAVTVKAAHDGGDIPLCPRVPAHRKSSPPE